jgi:hypothetical protein
MASASLSWMKPDVTGLVMLGSTIRLPYEAHGALGGL